MTETQPNKLRREYIKRQARKLFTREGLRRWAANPLSPFQKLREATTDRNMRKVPYAELLRDSEEAVAALARLVPKEPPRALHLENNPDTRDLGELFKKHGSDKSTLHNYFEVYGSILQGKRDKPVKILEIGLGTNNLAFTSNMGLGGRPGASVRAFRDWAPQAHIVGADIDRGVLFQEERIDTYWVDQTSLKSLAALTELMGGRRFDLIIDDGLHLPHANFNTLEALLPLLAPGGTFVVEDIDKVHLDYWTVAGAVLDRETSLVERKGGWIFTVHQ